MRNKTLRKKIEEEAAATGHAVNCTFTATLLSGEGSTECDCRASRFLALAAEAGELETEITRLLEELGHLWAADECPGGDNGARYRRACELQSARKAAAIESAFRTGTR